MRWSWLRLTAAAVALSGVAAGFVVNVDRAVRQGQSLGLVLADYFSFFTIISAILGAAVLAWGASWGLRHADAPREPFALALALAAVTGPVLLLGVVYNALLRGMPSAEALADSPGIALLDTYAVEVLHVVLPVYFVLDLLLAPRRRGLPWWTLSVLVGYPLLWTAYTMVRGELVANPDGSAPWWYPYPFLDPHGPGGYGSAFLYIGAICAGFLVIGTAVIGIGRWRERRAPQ
ncbi:Pr6Pr family membrane protein [Microbacterium sp.]|uniref:Pr6Pr family membrane protein n=1 Tax=Microbacterium sp. TaxID=51671 RepID=UPI0039E436B9